MQISENTIVKVLKILDEEIIPAKGCTEPIAIAYVAAKTREILGQVPEKIVIHVSGNMIKNVKSVVVPNSGGLTGISTSAAMGIVAGDSSKELMVISTVSDKQRKQVKEFIQSCEIIVEHEKSDIKLYVKIDAFAKNESASVEIKHVHTNITKIEKNGVPVINRACNDNDFNSPLTDRQILNIELIYNLAKTIDITRIRKLFTEVITLNSEIAEAGLTKDEFGVNLGKAIKKNIDLGIYGNDIRNKCASFAASGSDARMSGCPMPVMTTSGSGNQGMTASLPVIMYCREKGFNDEKLIRALFFSHLATIHIKTNVGRLSAYCGVVCASAAVGGAIAFIEGCNLKVISNAIVNTLGNISGLICDGAKASCAMKIATGIYTAFDSFLLAENCKCLHSGDGIVGQNVEDTIRNIGELSRIGMQQTDDVILEIMTK